MLFNTIIPSAFTKSNIILTVFCKMIISATTIASHNIYKTMNITLFPTNIQSFSLNYCIIRFRLNFQNSIRLPLLLYFLSTFSLLLTFSSKVTNSFCSIKSSKISLSFLSINFTSAPTNAPNNL